MDAIITIDNKKYKVNKSNNLLHNCLNIGFNIPYFCWHPALGSVGFCRQCAVKQYSNNKDKTGNIVMSCMTKVQDGMIISVNDNESKKFRKHIIELLMINHPHDCPICEEGGNCHLQDMTVMTEHHKRRYRFDKKIYVSQYLGPFISHEMNRCIVCYRCVRYYRNYSGGKDLGVFGISDNIYFGRFKEGILESEFSGNLVEICPTGVFTDKIASNYYNRKWDLRCAPSICQNCSIGCNIIVGERYGKICKIENRYHGDINRYFLCDLGRFGHDYVNREDRPYKPSYYESNKYITLNLYQTINYAKQLFNESNKIIGIGSSRASIESNFALRELVGLNNFYTDFCSNEFSVLKLILKIINYSGIYIPSLSEIEDYDSILILGEDITKTGARVSLSVRQAINNGKNLCSEYEIQSWQSSYLHDKILTKSSRNLFITSIDKTNLDELASLNYYASVNDQARLGFAIANIIDGISPKVNDLDYDNFNKANIIAQSLIKSKKSLIISGTSYYNKEIIASAANIALALKNKKRKVGINFIVNNVNSIGLSILGNLSLDKAFSLVEKKINNKYCVIVLENNLYDKILDYRVDNFIKKINSLIVLDHQNTKIQKKANLILPVTNFTESNGTVINYEMRAQRFFQVYDYLSYRNKSLINDSWRWLNKLNNSFFNKKKYWKNIDDVIYDISNKIKFLSKIVNVAPKADFTFNGQKISRESHRCSGRASIYSNINIHEQSVTNDKDSMFTFSMEGNNSPYIPNQHIPYVWFPKWNSVQAWNKFQDKIGENIRYGNPGIKLTNFKKSKKINYFLKVPKKIFLNKNQWLIVPYKHLFNNNEISQYSICTKIMLPKPYIVMNKCDAMLLNIYENDMVTLNFFSYELHLPVKLSNLLTSKHLGLPLGLFGIPNSLSGLIITNLKKSNL